MSATLTKPEIAERVVLRGVSWEVYETLLREIGDQPLYLTYDDGDLEIMSPSPDHETWKTLIGRMIELLTLEKDVEVRSLGSTTFKRRDLGKGLEPDECYYLAHESVVRHQRELDLRRDPPPDLVVEVDISHHAVRRAHLRGDGGPRAVALRRATARGPGSRPGRIVPAAGPKSRVRVAGRG